MDFTLRPAHPDDAPAISAVIIKTLRESNARDYTPEIIKQVEHSFSPDALGLLMAQRQVFVALSGNRIVGTASLDGGVIRSVFVLPEIQGRGVGRLLMARIEQVAREAGVAGLTVPSSVTAQPFYSSLGFKAVRDHYHGEERTIIMERPLSPP